MTQERLEEIRARLYMADKAIRAWRHIDGYTQAVEIIEMLSDDVAFVLDALEVETARIEDVEKENALWNDADCNKCPISTWGTDDGGCDDICRSKFKLIQWLADTDYDLNYYKARAEALERAIRTSYGSCGFCNNHEPQCDDTGCCSRPGATKDYCQSFVFDEARFAGGEEHV